MTNGTDHPPIPDPAEATDGSELGEQVGDDTLPGTVGFPPTDAVGVGPADSPSDLGHHDSLAERADREVAADAPLPHESVRFIDPNASGEPDTEAELIGETVPAVGMISPEEAAMHLEDDS